MKMLRSDECILSIKHECFWKLRLIRLMPEARMCYSFVYGKFCTYLAPLPLAFENKHGLVKNVCSHRICATEVIG